MSVGLYCFCLLYLYVVELFLGSRPADLKCTGDCHILLHLKVRRTQISIFYLPNRNCGLGTAFLNRTLVRPVLVRFWPLCGLGEREYGWSWRFKSVVNS